MSTTNSRATSTAAFTLFLAGVAAQHCAADDYFSPTDERVRLSLGAMYLSSSTSLQLDPSTGVGAGTGGTYINAEQDFGLSRSNFEPKFDATVRVETRHRLSLDYFTLDRSGDATVGSSTIVFKNVKFLPGDPLETQLSLRLVGLTYGYSFWHSPTLEIAGTLGVHATDISALAKVETQSMHIIQTDDQAGPLPTVGIDATWVASRRFYFDGRVQYVRVHLNDLTGSLGIYDFDALYRYRYNIAFGLGYTALRASLSSTKTSDAGFFNLNTDGPEMFFRIAF
jgi:hypothetical protein